MSPYGESSGANLADILERVLDKGIVIVGDIKINLLDIELLTIKLRLLVASVDKAREIGIDWWEHDPALSSRADRRHDLREQNERLRAEVEELRRKVEKAERAESAGELTERGSGSSGRRRPREPDREPTDREAGGEPRRPRRKKDDAEDRDRSRGREKDRDRDRNRDRQP
ncbi:gas vesicle protein [Streptomyces muensis]|uniref:Gas vesicle protein n=2 Tax=Streptomyces muensis TaxID=1077944 RepID=A0A9X1TKU3_STRM4|nr:gas vesicle protein [Streptomyces muensis]MCF1594400.1 gas vesicle protein [Streptomyces muensis]